MKKIFFLGSENSYSNIVAKKVPFSPDYMLTACNTFSEIVNKTLSEENSLGILPIENSITSDIHENIDFLFKHDLHIVYEVFLRIHLQVIGLPNSSLTLLTNVYSHPRALAQCSKFLEAHTLTPIETLSTTAARDIIVTQQDRTYAAIGSKELLSDNKLMLLAENIEDNPYNMTRFVFVSAKNPLLTSGKNKATIM